MIVSVAAVPNPPLLVPELVTGAVADTSVLRRACVAAAQRLAQSAPTWIAVAADLSAPTLTSEDARGTFRGYGADVIVSLSSAEGSGEVDPAMPLPTLVAGWLRAQAAADRVRMELVAPDESVTDCREFGARLAQGDDPVGLLVLGDGSTLHPGPSGRPDDRAGAYDAQVRDALAYADAEALLALDPELGAELRVSGRAAWQVLAGAAQAADHDWKADLLYSEAPYGVAYHVAVWEPLR